MPEQRKEERRRTERRTARPRISASREAVISAAKNFPSIAPLPNWTTVVEGRELPARALLIKAARVAPNNPTNSGEAAVILSNLGFEVRYKGRTIPSDDLPD
jgi:hypothetical protein